MNDLFEKLTAREERLAVVGLGYVGLPLAVAFARKLDTIGFDVNERKIAAYRDGHDVTEEAGDNAVRESTCRFTSDERELDGARFIVVAVPTPITNDKSPDLTPVISASETVGRHLQPGSVVVYESTVYPGVTQELCAAILQRESGLTCGVDFKIGYSPERINPGDKVHRLHTIRKIVSGMDEHRQHLRPDHRGGRLPRREHPRRRGGQGDRKRPARHQHRLHERDRHGL